MNANEFAVTRRGRRMLLSALVLGTVALAGCIVVPAGRGHRGGGPYAEGSIEVEPPGQRYEVIGVAPGPGYFWIGGNWRWGAGRYAWAPGRWEPSRPGYRWEPHSWRREGRGWRESPGHWSR